MRVALQNMRQADVMSSVSIMVFRDRNGLYRAALQRMTVEPVMAEAMELGVVCDVPPGQRRATWLLTDAVTMALGDPEAHRLMHW
jgi:hypothetical protein